MGNVKKVVVTGQLDKEYKKQTDQLREQDRLLKQSAERVVQIVSRFALNIVRKIDTSQLPGSAAKPRGLCAKRTGES